MNEARNEARMRTGLENVTEVRVCFAAEGNR